MNAPQAIFAGAAVIALALFAGQIARPAQASGNGPYQLMHHSNTIANAGVFRLDTSTGEVSYCYINAEQNLSCTKGVH